MDKKELNGILDEHLLWTTERIKGKRADLYNANLYNADLRNANLYNADLYNADLRNANIEFVRFPSIKLIASFSLGSLSDILTLELMRRDADGHPYPEKFDIWADGGGCPYQKEDQMWSFEEKRSLWISGDPIMSDRSLIIAICKEKGWKIKNFDLGK